MAQASTAWTVSDLPDDPEASSMDHDEKLQDFRSALDRLADERTGLLFCHKAEDTHASLLDTALADLEDSLRRLGNNNNYISLLNEEEKAVVGMIRLLHKLLQPRDGFESLAEVQELMGKSLKLILSSVTSPLFDESQLKDLDFASSIVDFLTLPLHLYQRRPRQSTPPRKKARYSTTEDRLVSGTTYLIMIVAAMVYDHYDTYEDCRMAVLDLARTLEPVHYLTMEPAVWWVWLRVFLRKPQQAPAWLTWEVVYKLVDHARFSTSIAIFAKLSLIPPTLVRCYLAEQFLVAHYESAPADTMRICRRLVSYDCAAQCLKDLQANSSTSISFMSELPECTHLPQDMMDKLQPYYPVDVHIQLLLCVDAFDEAVSLSRQLGELEMVPDQATEGLFKRLFYYLLVKGTVFYRADQPVLKSLFYKFIPFAGNHGFRIFAALYQILHDLVDNDPRFVDIKSYIQVNCRQTLLHLTAAMYPCDAMLQRYAEFMPVPTLLLEETMDKQWHWVRNCLATELPPLPASMKREDSEVPDFGRVLLVIEGDANENDVVDVQEEEVLDSEAEEVDDDDDEEVVELATEEDEDVVELLHDEKVDEPRPEAVLPPWDDEAAQEPDEHADDDVAVDDMDVDSDTTSSEQHSEPGPQGGENSDNALELSSGSSSEEEEDDLEDGVENEQADAQSKSGSDEESAAADVASAASDQHQAQRPQLLQERILASTHEHEHEEEDYSTSRTEAEEDFDSEDDEASSVPMEADRPQPPMQPGLRDSMADEHEEEEVSSNHSEVDGEDEDAEHSSDHSDVDSENDEVKSVQMEADQRQAQPPIQQELHDSMADEHEDDERRSNHSEVESDDEEVISAHMEAEMDVDDEGDDLSSVHIEALKQEHLPESPDGQFRLAEPVVAQAHQPPQQPTAAGDDEEYFAEESQMSEGDDEGKQRPRTPPRDKPDREAVNEDYDADATDGEDVRTRRKKRSRSQVDGYDAGDSQEQSEEDNGATLKARHEQASPAPVLRENRLSDGMSAADEMTTEADDSENDETEQRHFPVEDVVVQSQPLASLHQHALAAQVDFRPLADAALGEHVSVPASSGETNHEPEIVGDSGSTMEVPDGAAPASPVAQDLDSAIPMAPPSVTTTPNATHELNIPNVSVRHATYSAGVAELPSILEEATHGDVVSAAPAEATAPLPTSQSSLASTPASGQHTAPASGQRDAQPAHDAMSSGGSLRRSARKRTPKLPYVGDEPGSVDDKRRSVEGDKSTPGIPPRPPRSASAKKRTKDAEFAIAAAAAVVQKGPGPTKRPVRARERAIGRVESTVELRDVVAVDDRKVAAKLDPEPPLSSQSRASEPTQPHENEAVTVNADATTTPSTRTRSRTTPASRRPSSASTGTRGRPSLSGRRPSSASTGTRGRPPSIQSTPRRKSVVGSGASVPGTRSSTRLAAMRASAEKPATDTSISKPRRSARK